MLRLGAKCVRGEIGGAGARNKLSGLAGMNASVVLVSYLMRRDGQTRCVWPEISTAMKSLRILHSESSQDWGGQEHRTLKEMIALRDRGHAVEIVCPSDARLRAHSSQEGFTVHQARMRGGGDVRSMLGIKAFAQLLSRTTFSSRRSEGDLFVIPIHQPILEIAEVHLITRTGRKLRSCE